MVQIRQANTNQIWFFLVQHLEQVCVSAETEFCCSRLRLFPGAARHGAQAHILSSRKNAGMLPTPGTCSHQANLNLSVHCHHCSIRTLPVSPPKKNISNAC